MGYALVWEKEGERGRGRGETGGPSWGDEDEWLSISGEGGTLALALVCV